MLSKARKQHSCLCFAQRSGLAKAQQCSHTSKYNSCTVRTFTNHPGLFAGSQGKSKYFITSRTGGQMGKGGEVVAIK